MVDNQDKALKFYTEILGFVKKTEIPMGEHKWLTVVSKEEQDGVELVLEPMGFEPARTYQKALFEAGIPLTAFQVEDVVEEHLVFVARRLERVRNGEQRGIGSRCDCAQVGVDAPERFAKNVHRRIIGGIIRWT